MTMSLDRARIFVAGHAGMVGSAVVRRLASETCEVITAGRRDLDLRREAETSAFFARVRPDIVVLAAATVGGIMANMTRPAEFIYDNLAIQLSVIEAARRNGVKKLLLLGSSCIYPKLADQPITEHSLLTGPLEPTNEAYAVAKIAGVKMCEAYRRQYGCDFISAMPTNLYGPGDRFDVESGHVIPGLMVKAHRAKLAGSDVLEVWGTGTPRREFLYVDDLADACVNLLQRYSDARPINVGTGQDVSIRELAELICRTTGFRGRLAFDTSKPDGTPRKLLDVGRLDALGWRARTSLEEGLRRTYEAFLTTRS